MTGWTVGDKIDPLATSDYEYVAASQTTQALGATGGKGDFLAGVLIIPGNLNPGAVAIKDGDATARTVFAGGSASLTELKPFFVPLGAKSVVGKWQITTGADVTALAVGRFS